MSLSNRIERYGVGIIQYGNPELMSVKDQDTLRMYSIWKPTIKTAISRQILISCFFSSQVCELAVFYLKPEMFKIHSDRKIFEGICATFTPNQVAEFVSVNNSCRQSGECFGIAITELISPRDFDRDIYYDFIPNSIDTIKRIGK
jgi:DnaB-like helicase N terminal domain